MKIAKFLMKYRKLIKLFLISKKLFDQFYMLYILNIYLLLFK